MVNNKMLFIFLVLNAFFIQIYGQDDTFIRKGLVKFTATIAPSKMLSHNISPFYIHGILEYYAENNVSIAGEGYYYLGSLSEKESILNYHHNLFLGCNYHWIHKNSDVYLGLEPGISMTEISVMQNLKTQKILSINPLIGVNIGYNFFVGKYVHFFVQNKWVYGEQILLSPLNLSDFRISAGLGFQI